MERQGKQVIEQAMREKEKLTINKKWTKREEADFFRVASSYGVIYYRKRKAYDWSKFKQLSKLEKKTDEELTEYYKHFVMMCKKQTGILNEEGTYDTTIEHIGEEKARRTLERLELLSRIREEVITHPKLDERLKVCVTSADMPDWWISGKHDKELLIGVAKHGLGRTDYYLLDDPELSFHEILRKKVTSHELRDSKDAIKLGSREDIIKLNKDELLVKLEKGEGILKIEKVLKKENAEEKDKKEPEPNKIEMTLVKTETTDDNAIKEKESPPTAEGEDEEKPKVEKNEDAEKESEEVKEPEKEKESDEPEDMSKKLQTPEPKPAEPVKKTQIEEENDLCSKQAAELKAMFPDLEVIQPLSRLSQIDTFVLRDKQGSGALDFSETTVAQLFNNAVKWPKEYAIQVRLQHIIYAVETKEWPATKSFSAYATGIGNEFDIPIHELPNDPPKRETSTPMSVDSDINPKKRKRHIAIDVETERAKLHALLNSTSHLGNPMMKHSMGWDNDDSEDSRRSTPVQSSLQPPPAHQGPSRMMSNVNMGYDMKYHSPIAKTIGQTTVIPGTSSTLTPIDLSSSIPKTDRSMGDMGEVQDFSMPSKKMSGGNSSKMGGNKLDDTLSKLMKRKNCPEPEPVVGKEKKRKKLDEIVLGLSAAKEQSLFPEPTKKPTIPPSVTLTPTSAPISTSHNPSQKPFTITVTSVPSSSASRNVSLPNMMPTMPGSSKDSFSSFLAQAEQQNLLLKKQQQQRKSYEAMIADISKVSDYSAKVNSFSHEAKVNKWLAEQNAALAEQPLGADYLSPRRRRPRIDPSLLDWKKLTGDENVSVIHRISGKKLTGPKAPTLKRLGQWLVENPMYDIDPKWSELVKERGNLSHDLQKRVQGGSSSSGSSKKSNIPGRPPLMASPTGSNSSVGSAGINTSLPSNLSFPNLTGAGLGGINSNLLSGLSGLGQFDPKNSPLLMPFAGLPNMGALGSMGGLGNLNNMNLFANLAGLGLPGLGMDPTALAAAAAAAGVASDPQKGGGKSSSSSKQSKPQEAHSSSKSSNQASSNSIPTSNPFPFFFPNPSLLYTPLGLGGLNPFTLQPGMSAAYDTLAQQCGLLNGGNMNPAASPNSSSKSSKSSVGSRPSASSTMTTSSSSKPRTSSRDAHLQQLLLPPDTQILESITKAASSLDASLKQMKNDKKEEKRRALESLRGMLPTDFTTPEKLKEKKDLPGLSDFTKLLEAQVSQTAKKTQEQQMKEAIEQLSKNNAELMISKAYAPDDRMMAPTKRSRESVEPSPDENPAKKLKEFTEKLPAVATPKPEPEGVDIEALLPPSTVVKRNDEKETSKTEPLPEPVETPDQQEPSVMEEKKEVEEKKFEESVGSEPQQPVNEPERETSPPKKSTKRTRGKRKSGDLPPIDPESVREKKNLRSSASRSAAAAAARAAAAEHAAAKLEAEKLRESESGNAEVS